jgi:hypothetical protein
MSRLKFLKCAGTALTVLGCVTLLATPAAAQTTATASIAATANVVGVTPLTAVGVADLVFGPVLAGVATPIADPATQGGRFDLTGEPLAPIGLTYTLPTDLSGAGGTIPISFGPNDGLLWDPYPGAFTTFDPNLPVNSAIDATGNLTVGIIGTVSPAAGTTTGLYTGTITLTVSYL